MNIQDNTLFLESNLPNGFTVKPVEHPLDGGHLGWIVNQEELVVGEIDSEMTQITANYRSLPPWARNLADAIESKFEHSVRKFTRIPQEESEK